MTIPIVSDVCLPKRHRPARESMADGQFEWIAANSFAGRLPDIESHRLQSNYSTAGLRFDDVVLQPSCRDHAFTAKLSASDIYGKAA